MRELIHIKVQSPLELICEFDDKSIKSVNLSGFTNTEVFKFLLNANQIHEFVNKKYFIEWPKHMADLSADTLWHLGKTIH